MDLFYNKSFYFKDIVNILKFFFILSGFDVFVGGFVIMGFNFFDRSVFFGFLYVINLEEVFICCDLNVYLFYFWLIR